MDKKQRRRPSGPYPELAFASRLPELAAVVRDGARPCADQAFRTGLDSLLDGIEAPSQADARPGH
jgi:hypothetical protein